MEIIINKVLFSGKEKKRKNTRLYLLTFHEFRTVHQSFPWDFLLTPISYSKKEDGN